MEVENKNLFSTRNDKPENLFVNEFAEKPKNEPVNLNKLDEVFKEKAKREEEIAKAAKDKGREDILIDDSERAEMQEDIHDRKIHPEKVKTTNDVEFGIKVIESKVQIPVRLETGYANLKDRINEERKRANIKRNEPTERKGKSKKQIELDKQVNRDNDRSNIRETDRLDAMKNAKRKLMDLEPEDYMSRVYTQEQIREKENPTIYNIFTNDTQDKKRILSIEEETIYEHLKDVDDIELAKVIRELQVMTDGITTELKNDTISAAELKRMEENLTPEQKARLEKLRAMPREQLLKLQKIRQQMKEQELRARVEGKAVASNSIQTRNVLRPDGTVRTRKVATVIVHSETPKQEIKSKAGIQQKPTIKREPIITESVDVNSTHSSQSTPIVNTPIIKNTQIPHNGPIQKVTRRPQSQSDIRQNTGSQNTGSQNTVTRIQPEVTTSQPAQQPSNNGVTQKVTIKKSAKLMALQESVNLGAGQPINQATSSNTSTTNGPEQKQTVYRKRIIKPMVTKIINGVRVRVPADEPLKVITDIKAVPVVKHPQ